jgi:hypothetical protein
MRTNSWVVKIDLPHFEVSLADKAHVCTDTPWRKKTDEFPIEIVAD